MWGCSGCIVSVKGVSRISRVYGVCNDNLWRVYFECVVGMNWCVYCEDVLSMN